MRSTLKYLLWINPFFSRKKIVNAAVHLMELERLAEFEANFLSDEMYHRGTRDGMKSILSLIDPKAIPSDDIIKRGSRYEFVTYETDDEEYVNSFNLYDDELALSWSE
jgi:hypothetical protein